MSSLTIDRKMGRVATDDRALDSTIVLLSIVALSLLTALSKFGLFGMTGDVESGSLAGQIIWGTTYGVAAWRLFVFRKDALVVAKRSLPLVAFMVMILASSGWSVDPAITLKNAVEMIGTMLLSYYIVTRFTLPEFLAILVRYFVSVSIVSIVLVFLWPSHGRSTGGVVGWSGLWAEKNGFGAAMGLALITYVISFVLARGKRRLLLLLALLLSGVLFVGSQSTTAAVVLSVTGVIVGILTMSASPLYGLAARLISAIVALGLATYVLATGLDSATFFDSVGKSSTLTGRSGFWPGILRAIGDRPIFGFGYNAFFFTQSTQQEYIAGLTGWWIPMSAHNSYYQMILSVGFVGLAIYALAIIPAFVACLVSVIRDREMTAAWALAIMLFSLLGSFTEVYVGIPNAIGSICFTSALLFALKGFKPKTEPVAPDALRRKRSEIAVIRPSSIDLLQA